MATVLSPTHDGKPLPPPPNLLSMQIGEVIYEAQGMQRDTRLKVLGTHFHVHSAILKLRSNHFYKFYDSFDKVELPENKDGFKYEWTTTIDDDGKGWALQDARTARNTSDNLSKVTFDYQKETTAFKNVLSAMYGQEYELASAAQLIIMTGLADYYDALPALSISLHRALLETDIEIYFHANRLLPSAIKLQNKELFRDCVIHITGMWLRSYYPYNDDFTTVMLASPDNDIKFIAKARSKVLLQIYEAQRAIFQKMQSAPWFQEAIHKLTFSSNAELPAYFRAVSVLQKDGAPEDNTSRLVMALRNVLSSHLSFAAEEVNPWMTGRQIFLCAWVEDEDLPWCETRTVIKNRAGV